jgi:hypothetical protein
MGCPIVGVLWPIAWLEHFVSIVEDESKYIQRKNKIYIIFIIKSKIVKIRRLNKFISSNYYCFPIFLLNFHK